jgi:hypothetical protein
MLKNYYVTNLQGYQLHCLYRFSVVHVLVLKEEEGIIAAENVKLLMVVLS